MDNLEQNIQNPKYKIWRHFTEVTALSKILAGVLFITFPFAGFYLGHTWQKPSSISSAESLVITPNPTQITETKKAFLGGEIPATWNTYHVGEAYWVKGAPYYSNETITYSFSVLPVSAPPRLDQVNFRFVTKEAGAGLIKELSSQSNTTMSTETFDGVPVIVFHQKISPEDISIETPGGTDYLVALPDEPNTPGYLWISKVGLGNGAFENGFTHYIDTIDFPKTQELKWYSFENMEMD